MLAQPSARCLSLAARFVLGALLLCTAQAQAQADLAGVYKAGIAETQVDVSTWGKDCGPRPQNSIDKSQPSVTVKAVGTQLTLSFAGRNVRTDKCWSPNPAVRVASATATAGRWRTECQTPSSDAKRERGIYTLTASSEGVLELLEESSYDWQLNDSRCVAKIRVTQLVARGAAIAQLNKPAPTACVPGALTKLRLRPSELKVSPGARSCFNVRGTDAAGCVVPNPSGLKWELSKPAGATATLSGSCFKAADNAAEAEGKFRVSVSLGALHDEAPVTVAVADLSDITARRGGGGGTLEVDDSEDSASSFGIEAAVKRSSTGVKLLLLSLLLLILVLGWVVLRRSRRRAVQARERESELGFAATRDEPKRSERPARNEPVSGAGEQLICPQCRHGYPGGTTRCPRDGSVPIPYAEFVRNAQSESAGPRTCTSCGAQLAAGALFCGVCGLKVHS